MSLHALERTDERLVGAEALKVKAAVEAACARHGSRSVGVIAHRLNGQRGAWGGMESNGDCVVAIVRNGEVKTTYLRRATQTFDLSVSRTDVLVDMTGTVLRRVLKTAGHRGGRDEPFNPFKMN